MTTKDRIYRSPAAIAGGLLLLAIAVWLGIDALVQGTGRTPWLALAAMILVIPLVVAFTLRPAVFAGEDRMRVRNPFRVIVLPWGQVAAFRSSYSNEVVTASGTKYQLWSIPVSLRARKKAARRTARAEAGGPRGGGRSRGMGGLGFPGAGSTAAAADAADGPLRAETDKVMDELRELWESREKAESAQGEVSVRWAYEVLAPVAAGAVLLAILIATG
ncbi:PH domain-containing protein [Streptomyces sp. NBC_00663]|uniref:PH domain-containing protein n=1 Tax=Streptomyces sp. NBC_00663 TaxID=2975801 RepID=UPI002E356E35|nr:PH domain-containing protein [Streptomyces sp. NBC_00663]